MKIILITISILFSVLLIEESKGQCLNETQLLRMFKTNLNDIKSFMSNENWDYKGTQDNAEVLQYNCIILLQKIEWSKNNDKLQLYLKNNKIYILSYYLPNDDYCIPKIFSNLSINTTPKRYSLENETCVDCFTISEISKNGLVFQMSESTSEINIDLTIFNYSLVNNLVQIEKKNEKERLRKEEEKNRQFENALNYADSMQNAKKYEMAIESYKKSIELYPENQPLVEEKISNCVDEFKNFVFIKGDSLMNENNYSEALSCYNKFKVYSRDNEEIIEKINTCLNKHYDLIISEGDNLSYKELTDEAVRKYNEAYSLGIKKSEIDYKIQAVTQKKNNKITNRIVNEAMVFISEKDYNRAIRKYQEIFVYDKNNYIATSEIKRLRDLMAFLNKRLSYVYDYAEVASNSFYSLKKYFSDELNSFIDSNSNGNLDLQYKVAFDTLGINNSVYKLNSKNKSILSFLNGNSVNSILKPSSLYNYYVASENQLDIKLNWSTDNFDITSSNKGLRFSNNNYVNNSVFSSFIAAQPFQYGTYQFGVKHKTYNGNEYEDISLNSYSVRGPLNFIYSAIMPGWGTRRVTYGEKGWKTTLYFLSSVGISLGCIIYGANASDYKAAAAGLVAGGIAGSIYIYDIFSVINKGFKNMNASSHIRQKILNNEIMIKNQKIEIR